MSHAAGTPTGTRTRSSPRFGGAEQGSRVPAANKCRQVGKSEVYMTFGIVLYHKFVIDKHQLYFFCSCGREQGSGVELRRPRQGQIRGRRRVLK